MKAQMPADYEVPMDPKRGIMDAEFLRTCLGIRTATGEKPLPPPDSVRQAHYTLGHALSLLGAMGSGMTPTQLATVMALAVYNGAEVKEEESKDVFPAEEAESGQKVVIHWRQKDRAAHFLKVANDKIVVLHDAKEVKMRPDLVRFPKDGEFPKVADNINQQV